MSKKDKKKVKSQAEVVTDNLAKATGEIKKGKAKLVAELSAHAVKGEKAEWSEQLDLLRQQDQKVNASERVMKVLREQRVKELAGGNTAVEVVEPEGPKKGKKHADVLPFPKGAPIGVPVPTAEVDAVEEPMLTETTEEQPAPQGPDRAPRTDNQLKALQIAQTTADQTGRIQDVVVTRLYKTKNFGVQLVKKYQEQVPGIMVGGDEYLEDVDKWRVRLEVRPSQGYPTGASGSLTEPTNVEVPEVKKDKKQKKSKKK